MVCRTNNPGTGIQILQAAHSCLDKSFDHLQMDDKTYYLKFSAI